MNNYDAWKQATPPEFEFEDETRCKYCGEIIDDSDEFCDNNCRKGYKNDN